MKTNLLKAIALAIVMSTCLNCSVESSFEPVEQTTMVSEIAIIQNFNDTFENAPDASDITEVPCDGQNPKSRVTNNGNDLVNFEIFDAEGSLLGSVYNLNPGEVSDWKVFPVGVTTFKVSTSMSVKPVRIDMGICMAYDVSINEYNQLDTDIPDQL